MTLVVDTSALIALLLDEPQAEAIGLALADSSPVVIGAPTLVEAMIVAEARLGPEGSLALEQVIRHAEIEVAPLDESAAREAIDGWRRFGKGRHPAALNLGDCYSYGLARRLDAALLYIGDDFTHTDVEILPL